VADAVAAVPTASDPSPASGLATANFAAVAPATVQPAPPLELAQADSPAAGGAALPAPEVTSATVTVPDVAAPAPAHAVSGSGDLPAPAPQPSQLKAANVTYRGGLIVADGTDANPVVFSSGTSRFYCKHIELDTVNRTLVAQGTVRVERDSIVMQRLMMPSAVPDLYKRVMFTTVMVGTNLRFDFQTRTGHLDSAVVHMPDFDVQAKEIDINGTRYVFHDVVVRPGGLTDAERKIYGTPPISLQAGTVIATEDPARGGDRLNVKAASIFFDRARVIPVPSDAFGVVGTNSSNKDKTFSVTPSISLNSTDGVLITTRFRVPISGEGDKLRLNADVGLSEKVGYRGGVNLVSQSHLGTLELQTRKNDLVTTQLTDHIELDRLPELDYTSPVLLPMNLPQHRLAGFQVTGGYGKFVERTVDESGGDSGEVRADRTNVGITFSTRIVPLTGPYLNLFAFSSHYSGYTDHYSSLGYEVGYAGHLMDRVNGQVSYSSNSLSGNTPFQFDLVDIAHELRTTFDVTANKRYLIPIDLRYDLGLHELRDESYGLLRNYKTFAYGLVYQKSQGGVRLELRNTF